MKRKLTEHIFSVVLVSVILLGLVYYIESHNKQASDYREKQLQPFLEQSFIDLSDPFSKSLLKETLELYTPHNTSKIDSIVTELESFRTEALFKKNTMHRSILDKDILSGISGMYITFILAYLITMFFTYYAVQTLAIIRFTRFKQNRESYLAELYVHLRSFRKSKTYTFYLKAFALLSKAVIKGLVSLILFAPAYVIAYSFRTRFDTDTFLFLVILGVISNGLLITYAQKFFTFLMGENRKGYVETAMVKNLDSSYALNKKSGLNYHSIFSIRKRFPNHVFQHIYENARHQYLSTVKEQASFLITGLIIVEMALNIQGHLCYELLQHILYKNYAVVLIILLGIFYLVKGTEIFIDWVMHRDNLKYENRG